MVVDYKKYALFEYEQHPDPNDEFVLGEVVIKDGEIGVIIQCHGGNEYRTDDWGNCCASEIKKASINTIYCFRPELFTEEQLSIVRFLIDLNRLIIKWQRLEGTWLEAGTDKFSKLYPLEKSFGDYIKDLYIWYSDIEETLSYNLNLKQ